MTLAQALLRMDVTGDILVYRKRSQWLPRLITNDRRVHAQLHDLSVLAQVALLDFVLGCLTGYGMLGTLEVL